MNVKFVVMSFMLLNLIGCASIQANKDLNENPENIARGDPNNSARVRDYLESVMAEPENYKVKAYSRKAYSVNTNKNLFVFHSFYVYFKNDIMEHTLVFSATPKGSKQKGTWMLDASTDVESYNLFISSNNPWEVVEYYGPNNETTLDLLLTTKRIVERLEKRYSFFGGAIVRDLPWYHQLWMFLVPPPILTYTPLLLMSIHTDNCSTAVLDTMVWERL